MDEVVIPKEKLQPGKILYVCAVKPYKVNDRHGKKGLRERILAAKSKVEVDSLLAEGNTYTCPSSTTVRRWMKAADAVCRTFKS